MLRIWELNLQKITMQHLLIVNSGKEWMDLVTMFVNLMTERCVTHQDRWIITGRTIFPLFAITPLISTTNVMVKYLATSKKWWPHYLTQVLQICMDGCTMTRLQLLKSGKLVTTLCLTSVKCMTFLLKASKANLVTFALLNEGLTSYKVN